MHCLPAFHDTETTLGKQLAEENGIDNGPEVTNDVFEKPNGIKSPSSRPRTGCTRSPLPILVATLGIDKHAHRHRLGGNALLGRGQPMTAQNQRENVRVAAQALAPVAAEHDW